MLSAKRTQNEANFERQMRRFNARSGSLETSPNCLARFSAKHPGRAGFLSSFGMTQPGKYKKSGNELKEYLKTKDIAFLSAANYARFTRKLAQITRWEEQEQHNLRKRSQACEERHTAGYTGCGMGR